MSTGRSSDAAAWRQATSCLGRLPLWLGPPPADAPAPAVAVGAADVVARLVELVGGELRPARAFGRPWWLVVTARGLLAPGVPAPVAAPDDHLDARYWRDGEGIVREAQARADRVVSDAAASDATTPAVAVWFSEAERVCLFPELLDISNHHLRAVLPATAATVARVVAASAPSLVAATAAWPSPAAAAPATLEVGRETALLAAGWDDPDRFLAGRVEVEAVSGAGDYRRLRLVSGDAVELLVSVAAPGFTLAVTAGQWLYSRVALVPDGERVVVRAVPAEAIDLAAAPTRARLAFDLTATLLALGG